MVQVAHRSLNFGRHMSIPQPSSDVCILHKRLANRRADTEDSGDFSHSCANAAAHELQASWQYANFVINFCQILF